MQTPGAAPERLVKVEFLSSLDAIDPQCWNALFATDYPFLRHDFLYGLETSGCTTDASGWQPWHALLRDANDTAIAALPLYLKGHSYGEYVFDWAWADAWERSGLRYYPKLLSAIPFTPATGPRLGVAPGIDRAGAHRALHEGITAFARQQQLSSWHLLYPEVTEAATFADLGMATRHQTQFHWFNRDYRSYEDFLGSCASRKRKNLRRERQRVLEQGISLKRLTGAEITSADWQFFHRCYQRTYAKRSGHGGYLTREFFLEVAPRLADQALMVVAEQHGRPVAAALYFFSATTLYGRYWGCLAELDCLHFEVCYYQGIEFCIEQGLSRFDPGAQGEHKIQRGFEPVLTVSNHWIADQRFAAAVHDFTVREAQDVAAYRANAAALLPFRAS